MGEVLWPQSGAEPTPPTGRSAAPALPGRLLFDGALRPRHHFQPRVGNRLAAVDRAAVGAGGQSLLGPLDRRRAGRAGPRPVPRRARGCRARCPGRRRAAPDAGRRPGRRPVQRPRSAGARCAPARPSAVLLARASSIGSILLAGGPTPGRAAPRSAPGDGRDVGCHVLGVVTADQPGGHLAHAPRATVLDRVEHQRLGRAQHVEVGPDATDRVGRRQRVADGAVGGEQLAPVDLRLRQVARRPWPRRWTWRCWP